ncbi:MAG: hypothetical protein KDK30_08020 [Leptospiraceae bacterium]|nr:hypothetical protein [Leptospiraceae bacterium]MCB1316830.1 hypothetical protein [Leptospiraceae bacterium]
MKRLWLLLIVILSVGMLSPAYSQEPTDSEATEEDTMSPGEEAGNTADNSMQDQGQVMQVGAAMYKDSAGNLYANSRQYFRLNASDDLSRIEYTEYKIDDSSFRRYQGPINIEDEGPHTIVYRSVDRAGNQEVDRVYNVTIDNTAPVVAVVPARPFVQKDGKTYTSPGNTFTIRANDKYSGIKSIKYGVNSSELRTYEKNASIQLTESGSQLIQWRAEDNLGNTTVDGSQLVEVDGDKPTVVIKPTQPLIHVGETRYARRNTGFDVTGKDEGSGISQIMVRIDDSDEWQTYSDTIYFDTEEAHSIEAKAVDAVGNESEVVRSEFVVDDNPPQTELQPVEGES